MAFAAAIPAIAGALAGGAASAGGGLLDYFLNQKTVYDQMAQAREFAQNSIQWRVQDAQRAGVHPLFALGAPAMSSFPVTMESHIGDGLKQMGQGVQDALSRQDPEANAKNELEKRILAATADKTEAEAQVAWSDARRANTIPYTGLDPDQIKTENPYLFHRDVQRSLNDAAEPVGGTVAGPSQRVKPGDYEFKKPEVQNPSSFAPERKAGESEPMQKEFTLAPGLHIQMNDLGGESFDEVMSEMSLPAYIGLLMRNKAIYGDKWLEKFLLWRYSGKIPHGSEKFDPRGPHQRGSFHPQLREGR